MKHLHITLEDKEFEILEKCKDGDTWHDFVMKLADKEFNEILKKIKK